MFFEIDAKNFIIDLKDEVEIIIANNHTDFVKYLCETSFGNDSISDYMTHYAKWNYEFDGIHLNTDSPDAFVNDLIKHGYLKVDGNRYELHTQPNSVKE